MLLPTVKQATDFLADAEKMNPGQWVKHSIFTAQAAQKLSEKHPGLDPEVSYVFGLLHDIGRRTGVAKMRHIIDGYNFLHSMGFEGAARICLTHSFPYKDTSSAFASWDCLNEERKFVDSYLSEIEYNEYDRLIQLCDYLALPSGFCLMEKRMIDIALRYGANEYARLKWTELFKIKQSFEEKIGQSVYNFLPGVVENTFKDI